MTLHKVMAGTFFICLSITNTVAGQWEDYRNKLAEDTFSLKSENVENVHMKAIKGDAYSTLLIVGCIENRPAICPDHGFEKMLPELLIRDANTSNAVSKTMLGVFYLSGAWGQLEKNEKKGMEWVKNGAEAGDARALVIQAMSILNQNKTEAGTNEAITKIKTAVKNGDSEAMLLLAQLSIDKSVNTQLSSEELLSLIEKSAKLNNPQSMYWIAYSYFNDEYKSKDMDDIKAIKYLEKASNLGLNEAEKFLSKLSSMGRYKKVNKEDYLLKKYADNGISKNIANYLLSMCLIGVSDDECEKDFLRGISMLKELAKKDEILSNWTLFEMYKNGFATQRPDSNLAVKYGLAAKANLNKIYSKEYAEMGFTESGKKLEDEIKNSFDYLLEQNLITDPQVLKDAKVIFKPAPYVQWQLQPKSTDTEETQLSVKLSDAGGGLGDVQLWINGVLVERDDRNIALKTADASLRSFKVKLPAGQHQIMVRAYATENIGNFNELKTTLNSTWKKNSKPKLHLIALGVNQFSDESINLKYAKSDAKEVYRLLTQQIGGLYDAGYTTLLTDIGQTSKQQILNAFQKVKAQAQYDDVFVFYVASHGKNYESGGYYMLTSDVKSRKEADVKNGSLSQSELKDEISQIKTGKKFMLLDTCQAGKALKADELVGTRGLLDDEQDLMNRLRNKSGATILMASEIQQAAYEGYQNHGVFTYALIEAMGGAPSVKPLNAQRSTDDIMVYVEERVPALVKELFKADQKTYASRAGQGFPLVVVGR